MLFNVKLVVAGEPQTVEYDSVEDFLRDEGLQSLFDDGLVTECDVYDNKGAHITKPPLMDYGRLVDQVVSNSSRILQGRTR